jgi:hypothetical protein
MKTTWSVLILYENDEVRQEAVHFCDRLVQRFWSRHEFDFSWLPFLQLRDASAGPEAGTKASQADMIVFASHADGEVPPWLESWLDTWLGQRSDREGAMIALTDSGPQRNRASADKFVYLRNLAHRAGMDYLTRMPEHMARSIPDSLDSFTERADQVTHVLDEILHRPAPPRSHS